jgi:hypothetical protein
MELSAEDSEALRSLGRYRLNRGTAEFFALKKADVTWMTEPSCDNSRMEGASSPGFMCHKGIS